MLLEFTSVEEEMFQCRSCGAVVASMDHGVVMHRKWHEMVDTFIAVAAATEAVDEASRSVNSTGIHLCGADDPFSPLACYKPAGHSGPHHSEESIWENPPEGETWVGTPVTRLCGDMGPSSMLCTWTKGHPGSHVAGDGVAWLSVPTNDARSEGELLVDLVTSTREMTTAVREAFKAVHERIGDLSCDMRDRDYALNDGLTSRDSHIARELAEIKKLVGERQVDESVSGPVSGEIRPLALATCAHCFARVLLNQLDHHNDWHKKLDDRIRLGEAPF